MVVAGALACLKAHETMEFLRGYGIHLGNPLVVPIFIKAADGTKSAIQVTSQIVYFVV